MRSDFSPLEMIQNMLRYAWLVVGFMLLGGLAGWMVVRLLPPVYEAKITYSFRVDYAQTGMLSDIEYDHAMDAAGDLINADVVLEAATGALAQQGVTTDVATMLRAATQERTANDWTIRVRSRDAGQAAQIANAWGVAAQESLIDAYSHALRAQTILRYLDSVESCLGRTASSEPVQAMCANDDLDDILARFDQVSAELQRETTASRGLMPGLRFEWAERASVPSMRVGEGQGAGVLLGAMLGWLTALASAQMRLLDRFARKPRRD